MSDPNTDIVRELFVREVPEIVDGSIKIMAIARQPGYRSKIALKSTRDDIDSVAVCVGERGIRINKIVNALNNKLGETRTKNSQFEDVDIFPWNDDIKILIQNALQPFLIHTVAIDEECREATVTVFERKQPNDGMVNNIYDDAKIASEICGHAITVVYGK